MIEIIKNICFLDLNVNTFHMKQDEHRCNEEIGKLGQNWENKEQNGGKKLQKGAFLGCGNLWKYLLQDQA